MGIYEAITLLGIMVALAAIPSVSVALVVTCSATLGVGHGLAAAAGIVLADLMFMTLAIIGLSVVAEMMGGLFIIVRILGGLYLLWLGLSLLSTSRMTRFAIKNANGKYSFSASFMAGFLLTLGDIKAIFFYASLLPVFVDLSRIQASEVIVIGLITIFSVGCVKVIYAVFATNVATYAKRTNMESTARKAAGGLMIGAGGYLIFKA